MQTVNLVQASATITTITELKVGDIYKRLEESSYSGAKLKMGVVTGTLNNGEDSVITSLEYDIDYSDGVKTEVKVFGTNAELKIFPAAAEEVTQQITALEESTESAVRRAETALEKVKQSAEIVAGLRDLKLNQPTVAQLAQPSVATVIQ